MTTLSHEGNSVVVVVIALSGVRMSVIQALRLECTQLRWEASVWARKNMVGVEDKRLGLNRHSWGGGRAVTLKGTRLEWGMSV